MDVLTQQPYIFFLLYVWSLFWKGIALWRASNQKQKYWFIAMLALNTIGILEIIYLFKFSHKTLTLKEMKAWIGK